MPGGRRCGGLLLLTPQTAYYVCWPGAERGEDPIVPFPRVATCPARSGRQLTPADRFPPTSETRLRPRARPAKQRGGQASAMSIWDIRAAHRAAARRRRCWRSRGSRAPGRHRRRRDQGSDAFGDHGCRRRIAARQHQQEFLSAVAARNVVLAPDALMRRATSRSTASRSGMMAEAVVHRLEVIDAPACRRQTALSPGGPWHASAPALSTTMRRLNIPVRSS